MYTNVTNQLDQNEKVVLLPSAVVRFSCGKADGTIWVLLNSCSQATLVSDRKIRRFQMPVDVLSCGSIIGGATTSIVSTNQVAKLCLISISQCFSIDVEAEVVPPASMSYVVNTMVDRLELKQLSRIQLADPALAKNHVCIGDVDTIIGGVL